MRFKLFGRGASAIDAGTVVYVSSNELGIWWIISSIEQDSDWNWINRIDMYEWEKKCNSMMAKTSLQKLVFQYLLSYLILIRYCASATDSALPEMVMVRSMLPPDSRSSQLFGIFAVSLQFFALGRPPSSRRCPPQLARRRKGLPTSSIEARPGGSAVFVL